MALHPSATPQMPLHWGSLQRLLSGFRGALHRVGSGDGLISMAPTYGLYLDFEGGPLQMSLSSYRWSQLMAAAWEMPAKDNTKSHRGRGLLSVTGLWAVRPRS